MSTLKTQRNDGDVREFLNSIEHDQRREDSFKVLDMMTEVLGEEPKMWGASIIGFGSYKYKYASGKPAEWFLCGFSPRKQSLTLYIMSGFDGYADLMANLGKHTTGKSCLYIKKLEDIDMPTLKTLVKKSAEHIAATNQ